MNVAIVGAGIAGLAAARSLQQRGAKVVIFEKSRGVGGRVATRRSEGFVWDTGATAIAPRGTELERVMRNELPLEDLVEITSPIWVHHSLHPSPGAEATGYRATYRPGIRRLAELLAHGVDVRLEVTVDAIARDGAGFVLLGETYDAVIVTPPIPQTALLLWGLGESRPLAPAVYRPSLSIGVGVNAPTPSVPYHALIDAERRHPLVWLSLESHKSPGRAPEGQSAFVAQFAPGFSREQYRTPDAELVSLVAGYLVRLYGEAYREVVASTVMRWKFAQPTGLADFDEVNPPGSRLVVASDGLLGGRIHEAYDAGVRAARRVMEA